MINKTTSSKNDLKRVFKIGRILIPLVVITFFIIAVYSTMKPFFSKGLDWGNTRIFSPDDEPTWPFSYLALMKYDGKEYLDKDGNKQPIPQRLVFLSQDELLSSDSDGTIKFGTGLVTIPFNDLTMDLQVPELQKSFQQLCSEYSTSSEGYSKAEIHLATIPQQNGDMLYVMAKLIKNYAFRSVWTVDTEGNPTPIAFNWTNDRNGYRYRKDYTRQEILFENLYLPSK